MKIEMFCAGEYKITRDDGRQFYVSKQTAGDRRWNLFELIGHCEHWLNDYPTKRAAIDALKIL